MPKNFFTPTTKLVDRAADGKIFDAAATTAIKNRTGIYDRTAALLMRKANEFKATIRFKAKGKVTDAKSILGILSIGLRRGDELTILASGVDAQRTVDELTALIDSRFGEIDSLDGHAR